MAALEQARAEIDTVDAQLASSAGWLPYCR